jgi:alpha-tubulin suppressor-like RCC1 family protein
VVKENLLPTPVETLRGVRVGCVAFFGERRYAVADTGELWAWGSDGARVPPLGLGEMIDCPVPKPVESLRLRGIKVCSVAVGENHMLAMADDGSVYLWGSAKAARNGALGLGDAASDAGDERGNVHTPVRTPELRASCGL